MSNQRRPSLNPQTTGRELPSPIADALSESPGMAQQPHRRANALGLAAANHSGAGRGVIRPGGLTLTLPVEGDRSRLTILVAQRVKSMPSPGSG
jgi:hypothetical protein